MMGSHLLFKKLLIFNLILAILAKAGPPYSNHFSFKRTFVLAKFRSLKHLDFQNLDFRYPA